MPITIDGAGRVVIPQQIRRRLGLQAGSRMTLDEFDGGVLLRPVSRVRVDVGEDGLPVLTAPDDTPQLTTDDVRRLVQEGREWPRT